MSARIKCVWGVALIVALPLFAVSVRRIGRETITPSARVPDKLSAEQITAGVPLHRQRIVDFIEQTGAYSDFDELVAGLNDPVATDFDIVQDANIQVPGIITEFNPFLPVMADRRVARLYEMLLKMSPSDAEKHAAACFHAKLDIHRKTWMAGIDDWRDGEGPAKPMPIRDNYHEEVSKPVTC